MSSVFFLCYLLYDEIISAIKIRHYINMLGVGFEISAIKIRHHINMLGEGFEISAINIRHYINMLGDGFAVVWERRLAPESEI